MNTWLRNDYYFFCGQFFLEFPSINRKRCSGSKKNIGNSIPWHLKISNPNFFEKLHEAI